METFHAQIKKDDAGRLTIVEIPFNAKARFCKSKGSIYVNGTINGVAYRSRLLSRGGGNYILPCIPKTWRLPGQRMKSLLPPAAG